LLTPEAVAACYGVVLSLHTTQDVQYEFKPFLAGSRLAGSRGRAGIDLETVALGALELEAFVRGRRVIAKRQWSASGQVFLLRGEGRLSRCRAARAKNRIRGKPSNNSTRTDEMGREWVKTREKFAR
jgi:hypothetical protein